MSDASSPAKIQALLSADGSVHRAELTRLAFDAISAQSLSQLLSDAQLLPLLLSALTRENAERVTQRHGLPAVARIAPRLAAAEHKLRELLPEVTQAELVRVIASGKGPRFGWLKGAVDPADLRELFAPVVQQMLVQFTSKLPIPGIGGAAAAGGGAAGAALGGLVGMFGKQVQKSASQFAEVGKSVMGGLGSELERRMQALARDFSHTAMGELRSAVEDRLTSPEGKAILTRMRDRAIEHVMNAKLADVSQDVLRVPVDEIAKLVPPVVAYQREQPLLHALLETELNAASAVLGAQSLAELLNEAGLLESTRALTLRVIDPGAKALFASDAFGEWLARLLEAAERA